MASPTHQPKENSQSVAEKSATPSSYRTWMGTLTLVVLLAILIGFWQFSENLIGTIDRQAAELREVHDVLTGKRLSMASLRGSADQPGAYGRILWNPETGAALLHVSDLPPAPEGAAYRLWAVQRGISTSLGEFRIETGLPDFWKSFAVREEDAIEAFLVTLEPRSTDTPTGPVLLSGSALPLL